MLNNYVSARMRYLLGFVIIGIFFIFFVYNTIIIIIYSIHTIWMIIRRVFVLCRRKRIREEVLETTRKINAHKTEIEQEMHTKEWFLPQKIEGHFFSFGSGYGGYSAKFNQGGEKYELNLNE